MSVLRMHLFGKRPTGPFLSSVGVRVARCATAHNLAMWRAGMLAVFLGGAVYAVQSYFVFYSFTFRVARVPTPASKPLVVQAFEASKRVDPASAIPLVVVFALLFWLMPRLFRRMFDAKARTIPANYRKQQKKAARVAPWFTGSIVVVVSAMPVVFSRMLDSTLPLSAAVGAAILPISLHISLFGWILITIAFVSRRGRSLVCARCDYPMGSWRAAPPDCPECGGAWKAPWNTRIGARRISTPRIVWGAAAVLLSFGLQLLGAYMMVRSL